MTRTKRIGMVLGVLALVAVLGATVAAFAAGPGYGPRGGMMRGGGAWDCPRGFGPGTGGDLTDEEAAALQKERREFFEQTRELRDKAYQKRLELKSEIAKPEPDGRKAAGLQKEISDLEAQLGQARLERELKLKKENPKLFGRGFGPGMGPGYGRGFGGGPGFGRGGPCWQ